MDDDVHAIHGASQAVDVTDVTDEIPNARIVETVGPHLMLLELVPAKDDEFPDRFLKDDLSELLAEGARATGNQHRAILPKSAPYRRARGHRVPQSCRMI